MIQTQKTLLVILSCGILGGCVAPDTGATAPTASATSASPTATPISTSSASTPPLATADPASSDRCTNSLGNGDEIIAGPTEPAPKDFDSVFDALAVHPSDPNIIWIGTERNGVIKGEFNTSTREWSWQRSRRGIRHFGAGYPEIYSLAVSESDPQVLLAGTVDGPGALTEGDLSINSGIYKSIDGGESWFRMNCGILNGRRVTAVSFAPASSSVAFAVVSSGNGSQLGNSNTYYEGGVYRTDDGGTNWTLVTSVDMGDGANDSRRILSRQIDGSQTGIFTFSKNWTDVTKSLGLLKSLDLGQTFESASSPAVSRAAFYAFDVSSDAQVIAGAGGVGGAVISSDGGATWSSLPSGGGSSVAISPANPNIVLQSGGSLGTVGTISRISDALSATPHLATVFSGAPNTMDVIRFSAADPQVVYAVSKGYRVYRSEDAGLTWSEQADLRAFINTNP